MTQRAARRYEVDKLTSSQRLGALLARGPRACERTSATHPGHSTSAGAWASPRPPPRRADLNLEKNRIRDDLNSERNRSRDGLQGMRDKANELEIKMDKEVNALRAAVEQSKNEARPGACPPPRGAGGMIYNCVSAKFGCLRAQP